MRAFLLVLFLNCVLYPQTKVDDVKSFSLKNGMKVLVLEDHSIPNANMYFFWKVGSRNEYPGITGISHFFEHMMFNGAKEYGPKMFDKTMEAAGGANNAYTTNDITVYTDWFPAGSIETIFKLEADRICCLDFNDKMIESERGVILSERSTGLENSNYRLLSEQVIAAAMIAHPYRWPVIGWESDIKNWTKEDLVNYFKTYYAPNNGLLVISGDVNLQQVKELSNEYLAPIPANISPREIHTVEPVQIGEKRVIVHKEVSAPNIMLVYHTPESKSGDYYPLDLLSSILSSGKTSRLYSSLVDKKQLALSVRAYQEMSINPFLFTIYGVCAASVSPDSLANEIYYQLDSIKVFGVADQELQKVKNQKVMEFYHNMETIDGKSNIIGTYEIFFGDYKKLFEAPDEYNKVTVEDIKRVAQKYFTDSNRTLGILEPEEEK
jgi:zinc protease